MDIPSDLPGLLAKLPSPRGKGAYFRGTSASGVELPRGIVVFGRQNARWLVRRHDRHHRLVLIVALRTAGEVMVDTQYHRIKPGCALLLFPYQFHQYPRFEDSDIAWLFIGFELNDPKRYRVMMNRVMELTAGQTALLREILNSYTSTVNSGNPALLVLLVSLLLERLLDGCNSETVVKRETGERSVGINFVKKVNAVIAKKIGTSLTVKEIARDTALSDGYLRSLYKKHTGMSLGYFIKGMRISRALRLLSSSPSMNISQIAYACGFNSIFSFSRSFKAATGSSPREFRKEMAERS